MSGNFCRCKQTRFRRCPRFQWHDLFMAERLAKVGKELKKRVVPDLALATPNKTAKPDQIKPTPGPSDGIAESHITPEQIAEWVRGYKLENPERLAWFSLLIG